MLMGPFPSKAFFYVAATAIIFFVLLLGFLARAIADGRHAATRDDRQRTCPNCGRMNSVRTRICPHCESHLADEVFRANSDER